MAGPHGHSMLCPCDLAGQKCICQPLVQDCTKGRHVYSCLAHPKLLLSSKRPTELLCTKTAVRQLCGSERGSVWDCICMAMAPGNLLKAIAMQFGPLGTHTTPRETLNHPRRTLWCPVHNTQGLTAPNETTRLNL